MAWYYHLNGNTLGPVEPAQMQDLFRQRTIGPDTLVWKEGMAQWEPYRTSEAGGTASTAVATAETQLCAECGRRFPETELLRYENSWVCAACKPIFFQRIKEGAIPQGTLVLASIGNRFLAVFIDGLLIMVVSGILLIPFYMAMFSQIMEMGKHPAVPFQQPVFSIGMRIYSYVVSYGLPAAYEIFFLGTYGATLGKMAMKLKVVTAYGQPISYGRATGRHFAKLLSFPFTLGIGYLIAFWDDEKRTLHDHICKTRVIANNS
jgi:uncharacterized RDD family membrane protein YckC